MKEFSGQVRGDGPLLLHTEPFRVSSGLKDLIGRDLITNDFVAVFELVKNSFDAHATLVKLFFEQDKLVISDNGKGMSRDDILGKWLFVAYSAKRDGTEDQDYQSKTRLPDRPFAGAKGIGRFACDRLGKQLSIFSRAASSPIQVLEIDWTRFENNAQQVFEDVGLELRETEQLPDTHVEPDGETGTVLEIKGLRSEWDREKLLKLKRELARLINPFASRSQQLHIELVVPEEKAKDDAQKQEWTSENKDINNQELVNGRIENTILDVLKDRTTSMFIKLTEDGGFIESVLRDRGEEIYSISESNPYDGLNKAGLKAEIYYLNRGAKKLFAHRMGLPSVQFGSIFLFRNGFRVFPIGQETDDFFGIARRKQQGTRRFLGSRDLIGRVEIKGIEGFDEATSRDQGLIRTPQVEQLIQCIREKCIVRLERYVVDITWIDQFDKDQEDISRMKRDESSALITQLVSKLAATKGLKLLSYNPELVRIVDEKSTAFEDSLKALELLAEKTGDSELIKRVAATTRKIEELKAAEEQAREAERRADARAEKAETVAASAKDRYEEERKHNQFLMAAASLDQDTILNLHHQIIMHASDVHVGVKRMMRKLREKDSANKEEWVDFLENIAFRNSQILTASRFATKGGYKQQLAEIQDNLVIYIRDYITTVSSLWSPRGIKVEVHEGGGTLERGFRPIEVGIVIDNLVSNAAKARASRVEFFLEVGKGAKPELSISVADDGDGWPKSFDPLERAFEKGVTTTEGSGLGLYHVKQVIERLGGIVEAHREPYSEKLHGALLIIRIPS